MSNFVVTFVHIDSVAQYGDTEVTVHGQWPDPESALQAVIAKFGDGVDGIVAPEQQLHVFNADTSFSQYYALNIDADTWERTY